MRNGTRALQVPSVVIFHGGRSNLSDNSRTNLLDNFNSSQENILLLLQKLKLDEKHSSLGSIKNRDSFKNKEH